MSRFPRMVQRLTEKEFARCHALRADRLSAIRSRSDAIDYIETCRKDLRGIYALPDPDAKCSLNVRSMGRIEHKLYTIEKIIFESRTDFLVPANIYVPKTRRGVTPPFPCVLGTCGHSNDGKAEQKYQLFCAGLASKGFLVLIYDPISQGERIQYPEQTPPVTGCVAEHVVLGAKLSLLGDYFGSWRAWDAVRALDVLLNRPDADSTRVGMTGNSGGGTMTTIVTALEDRLTMVAPSCFITSYRHNLKNELPADTEQIPPGILAQGYELYDHLAASAPRPVIILSKEDDFFDVRGAETAFTELKSLYSFLGAEQNLEFFTGKGGHGFDRDLREAMYRFFCKHSGIDVECSEPEDLTLHSAEELFATSDGNVSSEGSRRVIDFAHESLDQHEQNRRNTVSSSPDMSIRDVPEHLARSIGIDPDAAGKKAEDYRVLRVRNGRSRFALSTGGELTAILSFDSSSPVGAGCATKFNLPRHERGILVIPGTGAIEDEECHSFIEQVPIASEYDMHNAPTFLVSPRGLGESIPETCGGAEYSALYDADFFYASYGIMMDKPLAGGRVCDILSAMALLKQHGYREITIAGHGFGALLALYTATFADIVKEVIIKKPFDSLASVIRADYLECPISFLPTGACAWYDLDDIAQHLESRNIRVIDI